MVRSALLVGFALAAGGAATTVDDTKGWCVLNGAAAVNDLMDAGVYSWAASRRCGQSGLKAGNAVKCEIDVASAAESVNRMINVIITSINTCGNLPSKDSGCGLAASKLTAHFSGIAAAAGGVVQECKNMIQTKHNLVMRDSVRAQGAGLPLTDPQWPQGEQATCAIDIKDSLNQIFAVSLGISKAGKNCDNSGKCVYDSLEILSAFVGLGKYLMGAVGHCTQGALPVKDFPLTCSEHIAGLTRSVTGFIADSDELQQACNLHRGFVTPDVPRPKEILVIPQSPNPTFKRLYSEDDKDCKGDDCSKERWSFSTSTVLGAMLPVSALVGFVGGMRLSGARHGHEQLRDMELLSVE